jgi:hypothetical protein
VVVEAVLNENGVVVVAGNSIVPLTISGTAAGRVIRRRVCIF